jgi:DNA repair exonuclease SbcCD ATPase subunit
MITIKELRWSNAFSYGKDNKINFVDAPLTQLVGRNGHGKSSIALILEEVLFNKNSKGIKKADILNRYVKDKSYSIELDFERDGTEYTIKTNRGSTQTVKLFKDGVDVSSHTATATYKMIEETIGIDHKAFSQIVYQSNASSLEFLSAPDTARKKFLIEILNLGKYTRAQEVFKEVATQLSKDIAAVQSQVNTVKSWLDKYEKTDLTPMSTVEVDSLDSEQLTEAAKIQASLQTIESTNKKISQNNTYKQLQTKIQLFPVPEKPTGDTKAIDAAARALNNECVELQKTVRDSKSFIQKMEKLSGTCPTCLQPIDTHKISELVGEQEAIQNTAVSKHKELQEQLEQIAAEEAAFNLKVAEWQKAVKSHEDWEKYHQLIDETLPEEILNKDTLEAELNSLNLSIKTAKQRIAEAEKHNNAASAHNAKIDLIKTQLVEMNAELETHSGKLHELNERMSIINVLSKTFSTTGLVAYKIECLVKDLEEITNRYLVDLSDGRFQISFKINSSDKLNVVITDNGKDIEILALSGGEKARVNIATLLAIRKLMQTLSSSRINLLVLDETVEALDVDGKEKLVEVLLREEHLNTFLVSHGFTHPLLEKVNVVKRNNISQIEV